MRRQRVRIVNPMGMHARPAGRFVALAGQFQSRVRVRSRGEEVDGSSILSLLMLEAVVGTELEIVVVGPDEQAALDALAELVEGGFEERDSFDGKGARG